MACLNNPYILNFVCKSGSVDIVFTLKAHDWKWSDNSAVNLQIDMIIDEEYGSENDDRLLTLFAY